MLTHSFECDNRFRVGFFYFKNLSPQKLEIFEKIDIRDQYFVINHQISVIIFISYPQTFLHKANHKLRYNIHFIHNWVKFRFQGILFFDIIRCENEKLECGGQTKEINIGTIKVDRVAMRKWRLGCHT